MWAADSKRNYRLMESRDYGDRVEYIMEAWTYDTGPDWFHIIIFKGNRVFNIESEMK
jgi:hypothetical protein